MLGFARDVLGVSLEGASGRIPQQQGRIHHGGPWRPRLLQPLPERQPSSTRAVEAGPGAAQGNAAATGGGGGGGGDPGPAEPLQASSSGALAGAAIRGCLADFAGTRSFWYDAQGNQLRAGRDPGWASHGWSWRLPGCSIWPWRRENVGLLVGSNGMEHRRPCWASVRPVMACRQPHFACSGGLAVETQQCEVPGVWCLFCMSQQ